MKYLARLAALTVGVIIGAILWHAIIIPIYNLIVK